MPARSAASCGASRAAQLSPRLSSHPGWFAWKYVRAAASMPYAPLPK